MERHGRGDWGPPHGHCNTRYTDPRRSFPPQATRPAALTAAAPPAPHGQQFLHTAPQYSHPQPLPPQQPPGAHASLADSFRFVPYSQQHTVNPHDAAAHLRYGLKQQQDREATGGQEGGRAGASGAMQSTEGGSSGLRDSGFGLDGMDLECTAYLGDRLEALGLGEGPAGDGEGGEGEEGEGQWGGEVEGGRQQVWGRRMRLEVVAEGEEGEEQQREEAGEGEEEAASGQGEDGDEEGWGQGHDRVHVQLGEEEQQGDAGSVEGDAADTGGEYHFADEEEGEGEAPYPRSLPAALQQHMAPPLPVAAAAAAAPAGVGGGGAAAQRGAGGRSVALAAGAARGVRAAPAGSSHRMALNGAWGAERQRLGQQVLLEADEDVAGEAQGARFGVGQQRTHARLMRQLRRKPPVPTAAASAAAAAAATAAAAAAAVTPGGRVRAQVAAQRRELAAAGGLLGTGVAVGMAAGEDGVGGLLAGPQMDNDFQTPAASVAASGE